jgi:hypothetical protein
MDYNQILSTIGVTQGRLETIIIFTVIAIGIGIIAVMYWKFLMAGFFALVLLFVFSRSEPVDIEVIAKPVPFTTEVIPVTPVIELKPESDKVIPNQISKSEQHYMEDCLSLTGKKTMCEDLWKQRQQ